jgi:hypothetical protein
MEHINTLCGQNTWFLMFKQVAHKVATVFQRDRVARIMRSRMRGAERDKTSTYILSEKRRGKERSAVGSYDNTETGRRCLVTTVCVTELTRKVRRRRGFKTQTVIARGSVNVSGSL